MTQFNTGYDLTKSKKLMGFIKSINAESTKIKYTGLCGYYVYGVDFQYKGVKIEIEPIQEYLGNTFKTTFKGKGVSLHFDYRIEYPKTISELIKILKDTLIDISLNQNIRNK